MRSLVLLAAAGCLAAQDSRNTRVIDTNTPFAMPKFASLAEWEARRDALRQQVRFAAGVDPAPEKNPLTPQIFGRITNKDYSIEKVLIQTLPGYWLGGNLYRPVGRSGKFPAVVSPHGHWVYGRIEHSTTGSIPARCINLARQGFVVFAYDMVGYNDTVQTGHGFGGKAEALWSFHALGLQTWNSIRAVDFVQSLADVDPEMIAATGASGGGTQTFLLTALDERVKVAAPVNMISGIMQGGSVCENAPGLRFDTFNVEIAALTAPRPMLMVSATGDWTKNTLEQEYPAIKSIYALYDRAALVEGVRIDAPHNYNKDSREAVYAFFAKHARKDTGAPPKEQNIRLEKPQDMLALHGRSLPPGALSQDQLFQQWKEAAARQAAALPAAEKKRLLMIAMGATWPKDARAETRAGEVTLRRASVGDRVRGVWIEGSGAPALVVHPGGAEAARKSLVVGKLIADKRPVLLIDAFQTGAAAAPRNRAHTHFLTFNRSDDQARAQDILTALAWLEGKSGGKTIEVVGLEAGAVWARFAAAVAPVKTTLNAPTSFSGSDREFEEQFFVPGIQRAGGWKAALALTRN